jgi:hypothetical protein
VIVVIGSPIGRLRDGLVAAAGMASRVALAAAAGGRTVQLVGRTGDDPTADLVILDLARGGVGHVALLRDSGRATPLEMAGDDDGLGEDATAEAADPAAAVDDEGAGDVGAGQAVDAVAAAGQSVDTVASAGQPVDAVAAAGQAITANDRAHAASPGSSQAEGPTLEAADVDLGLRYLTEFSVVVLAEPADPGIVTVVSDAARWGEARMILVVGAGHGAPDGLPADVVVFEAPATDPDGAFASMVGTFAAALDDGLEPGEAFRGSIATDGWTGAVEG